MGAPVPIRDDIPAEELRRLARLEANGQVACRLLALAGALDGMSRERAARQAGMDRQTLRDWVTRAAEHWRSIRVTEFERRQMATLRQELDHDYEALIGLDRNRSKPAPPPEFPAALGLDPRPLGHGTEPMEPATTRDLPVALVLSILARPTIGVPIERPRRLEHAALGSRCLGPTCFVAPYECWTLASRLQRRG